MSLLVSPVFVGRGRELDVLMGALEGARAGDPSVVIVGGDAGVGKTRLVEETAARAGQADARVLIGSCVELGGEGLPFAPLVDALRELARTTDPDELEIFLGPARRELARLLPELDPAASATLSDGGSPASRLFELVLGVVGRLAAQRPLLLVIEALHWADRSTLDLVTFLVRTLRGARAGGSDVSLRRQRLPGRGNAGDPPGGRRPGPPSSLAARPSAYARRPAPRPR